MKSCAHSLISRMTDKTAWAVYLLVNSAFIFKYVARTPFSPLLVLVVWLLAAAAALWTFRRLVSSEQRARWAVTAMTIAAVALIATLLIVVDPLSVNVDRWSATTYWLDALADGVYPYGVHTHVCETNYPSPFPLWHYLNLPFWLMGDVGLGLIFFLLLLVITLQWYQRSWRLTALALMLLLLSPAYWWEVAVRSDGLSNAILIFCVVLFMERRRISFTTHWPLAALIVGLAASTRLSAIIPLGLYLAASYLRSSRLSLCLSPLIAVLTVGFFFLPFILWDTTTWPFLNRNPLLTQSSTGNPWTLLVMAAVALLLVFFYNTDLRRYMTSTAAFMFVFFLVAITYNHLANHAGTHPFDDADFDISYLSLSLPYALYAIAAPKTPSLST